MEQVSLLNWRRDQRGGVAAIFAVSIVPLVFLTGAALDYSSAQRVRAALQAQVDASVLAAAIYANDQTNAGNSVNADAVVTKFKQEVTARHSGLNPATVTDKTGSYSSSTGVTGTITATLPAQFGKLMGFSQYTLRVTASTAVSTGDSKHAELALVLDVSPSMAVASTAAGIAQLKALTLAQTGTACAYACHDIDSGTVSNYTIARNGGVTLRIDEVKSAATSLVDYISGLPSNSGHFKVGLYSMSSSLKTLQAPTASFPSVKTAISAVDFDKMSVVAPALPSPAPANIASGVWATHYGDSDFTTTLTALNAAIPANGTGASAASPLRYVILVTDGLDDTGVLYNTGVSAKYNWPATPNFNNGNDWGKYTKPLSPALCDAFKSRGVQVAVLYIPYVADPTDADYQYGVETNAPPTALASQLTACATSGLFLQADNAAAISSGLQSLFKALVASQPRLTK